MPVHSLDSGVSLRLARPETHFQAIVDIVNTFERVPVSLAHVPPMALVYARGPHLWQHGGGRCSRLRVRLRRDFA